MLSRARAFLLVWREAEDEDSLLGWRSVRDAACVAGTGGARLGGSMRGDRVAELGDGPAEICLVETWFVETCFVETCFVVEGGAGEGRAPGGRLPTRGGGGPGFATVPRPRPRTVGADVGALPGAAGERGGGGLVSSESRTNAEGAPAVIAGPLLVLGEWSPAVMRPWSGVWFGVLTGGLPPRAQPMIRAVTMSWDSRVPTHRFLPRCAGEQG